MPEHPEPEGPLPGFRDLALDYTEPDGGNLINAEAGNRNIGCGGGHHHRRGHSTARDGEVVRRLQDDGTEFRDLVEPADLSALLPWLACQP